MVPLFSFCSSSHVQSKNADFYIVLCLSLFNKINMANYCISQHERKEYSGFVTFILGKDHTPY